jgi:hypothetical protein
MGGEEDQIRRRRQHTPFLAGRVAVQRLCRQIAQG